MTDIVEVVEGTVEVIEVIEPGPQGSQGPQGPVGTSDHEPMLTLLASSKLTQVLTQHDGTILTEQVIDFGTSADANLSISGGVLTVLQDIDGFSAVIELNTEATGPGGQIANTVIWTEVSVDSGVTWVLSPDSLHITTTTDLSSGVTSLDVSANTVIPAGMQMRLVVTKTGNSSTTITIKPADDIVTSRGIVSGVATKATMIYRINLQEKL